LNFEEPAKRATKAGSKTEDATPLVQVPADSIKDPSEIDSPSKIEPMTSVVVTGQKIGMQLASED